MALDSNTQRHSHPAWRRRLGRLALLILAPAFTLGLVEGILRLAGAGYPTRFFVETQGSGFYTGNERFIWQFYSTRNVARPDLFLMSAKKNPGTIRIFILGESAAMGTPE